MSGYALTPTAQRDLVRIRDYYLAEAGHRVARMMLVEFVEAFRLLAKNPGAGHTRKDLAEDRPILFWPMRAYLILYQGGRPIKIITIARGSQDVARMIESRGL